MTTKLPTAILSKLATLLMVSFLVISCNNNAEEKKEAPKDSLPPAAITPPDSMNPKKDSIPMDSADTKPVKTTNK